MPTADAAPAAAPFDEPEIFGDPARRVLRFRAPGVGARLIGSPATPAPPHVGHGFGPVYGAGSGRWM